MFVIVNVDAHIAHGKENNAGVFDECPFQCAIEQGRMKLPNEEFFPGSTYSRGDAAFPLKENLIKPFPENSTIKGEAKDNINHYLGQE